MKNFLPDRLNRLNKIYWFALFFFIFNLTYSQSKKNAKTPVPGIENYYLVGNYYFLEENYIDAHPFFDTLRKYYPKTIEYWFKAGVCYLHKPAYVDTGLALLLYVYEKKPKTEKILYWLGRAYCLNYEFDKGIACFNNILTDKKISPTYKKEVEHLIRQAESAKQLVKNPVDVKVRNLGAPVNSEWDEYSPIINSDGTKMMFTYRGPLSTGGKQNDFGDPDSLGTYFEDIFYTEFKDGSWKEPQKLDSNINTKQHEATVQLSPDGQTMLYYKDTEQGSGDILITSLEGNIWLTPERLPICSPEWEGSAAISPDVKFIIFSSDRPGGYGGIDLYLSKLDSEGFWGPAENLGPVINTEYNEDGVFIHPDGKTIIFSSEGHNSMGGYDIFITRMNDDGTFSQPENLGYPINTPGNDIFFVVTGDGRRAYFSSERKDGLGRKDIYEMDVSKVIRPKIVGLVKGITTEDHQPIGSKIFIKEDGKDEILLVVTSNSQTGEYQFNLPAGKNFQITYVSNVTGVSKERKVYFDTLQLYTEKKLNVDFAHDYLSIDGKVKWYSNKSANGTELLLVECQDTSKKWFSLVNEKGEFSFTGIPLKTCYKLYVFKTNNETTDDTLYVDAFAHLDGTPVEQVIINEIPVQMKGLIQLKLWKDYNYQFLKAEKSKISLLDNFDEGQFVKKYGDFSTKGLAYKVQIGAFRNPANFRYNHVKSLGKVTTEKLDDGITRFYIGGDFKTYNAAKKFCDKVIQKGIIDAFVLVTYNGKRTYVEELIKMGILPE